VIVIQPKSQMFQIHIMAFVVEVKSPSLGSVIKKLLVNRVARPNVELLIIWWNE